MKRIDSKQSSKSGFALIVVAFLISMMLLIGAAMVSLMQVEGAATQYEMQLRTARDNARYSLNIALGELQKHAGIDQVVTALADGKRTTNNQDFKAVTDPASTGVYEPFWTGVWRTGGSSGPEWLVTKPTVSDFDASDGSSEAGNPYIGQPTDSVVLVGPGTADLGDAGKQGDFNVTVPLEVIRSDKVMGLEGTATTIGKYGYWVGDLGVKASYGLRKTQALVDHDKYNSGSGEAGAGLGQVKRLEQMVGEHYRFGVGLDHDWSYLASLSSDFQLRNGESNFGLSESEARLGFHDYTLMSRNVLSNTIGGGLKVDLSAKPTTGVNEIDDYLIPYANLAESSPTVTSSYTRRYEVVPSDPSIDQVGIYPVVTGFAINFGFEVNRSTGRMKVKPNLSVEIWNPYTSAISSAGGFELNVKDLPGMVFKYRSGLSEFGPFALELKDIFDDRAYRFGVGLSLRRGQIARYSGGKNNAIPIGPYGTEYTASSDHYGTIELSIDDYPGISDFVDEDSDNAYDDEIVIVSVEEASPGFVLKDYTSGVVLLDSAYIPNGGEWYDAISDGDIPPFTIDPRYSDDVLVDHRDFGYAWDLKNPDVGNGWLDFDPRADAAGALLYDRALMKTSQRDPSHPLNWDFDFDVIVGQDDDDGLISHIFQTGVAGEPYDICLFEIPRQDLVSLSGLIDARFSSGLRWQLGRDSASLGSEASLNALFDEYYYSTIPQGTTDWAAGDPLPHSRLQMIGNPVVGSLQSSNSAEHFFLSGAFNINSTSIDAWKSVLRSISIPSWSNSSGFSENNPELFGEDENGNDVDTYQFFRFSQTAEEVWRGGWGEHEDPDNPNDLQRKAFRKGVTSLSVAQLDALSAAIVSEIRARMKTNGPFQSIGVFLDEGIINKAIAVVDGTGNRINPVGVHSHTMGYFDQRWILNAIGSFVVARSDTFVIRAYGSSINPFDSSEVIAEAYCEAVVQRMPDKVLNDSDTDDSPITATGTGQGEFGRQFRVIDFRWLNEGDL